ncbi:bis(5'-nucleosyl)-tetraphosphatase PrpE [Oceanobacillus manasiensis]|uniref:bis(5'-nucleosyl)-tetraphosphatase PrpE n=1 Tax=Oceanobacillus manasiensis TaxID=586413 RepID=UPI0005AB254F|nr:bis(5'-nucleosyl)-tetraphosphatase PrpE [Oceanobacillus manasiensis]
MEKVDIIGDVHGCFEELHEVLAKLGYLKDKEYNHPDGRILVFVGDITDRGPESLKVIELVYYLVMIVKKACYVPGNHCNKLYRFFLGNKVQQRHGLETTVAEYEQLPKDKRAEIKQQFITLYEQAPLYLQIPEVNAIVAHAGIKESLIGRTDKQVKTFVLYGDITGDVMEDGRPVRKDWAKEYNGKEWIVYGHTPVLSPRIVHNTINIDTGCVFGNELSAFRLPEKDIISVPSKQPLIEEKFSHFED